MPKKFFKSAKVYRSVSVFLCNNVIAKDRKGGNGTIKICDLINKRRLRWEQTGSIEYDRMLTEAICDKILDNEELRCEIIEKPYLLIESCFTIVNKEKRDVPFFLNTVQRDFIKRIEELGTSKPFFVLKGRQQGFTSLITAMALSFAIVRRNFAGFTVADRDDNTKAIFIDKAKQIYARLPERLKPTEKLNSVNELFFDKLNSSWRVASASANIGRSRTLSFIHYSEVAFFRCALSDLQKSIQEALIPEGICIYETTANGFNEAKELWDSGSCHNLFYEWWKTEEYASDEAEFLENPDPWLKNRLATLEKLGVPREQRIWYAKKYSSYIDKDSIKQEYPCSPEEAFIATGKSIFDRDAISEYLSSFNIKSTLGEFEYDKVATPISSEDGKIADFCYSIKNIRFVERAQGCISLVEKPYFKDTGAYVLKKPYVIGADTAGTGQDYFCAKVIDNVTGKCVATLHRQYFDEDLFAEQLYCLGKYFNDALIAVETNYSRHPVRHLRALGYENLYLSRSVTTYKDEKEKHYGFITSSVTRPIIISNLVSVMRENIYLETDRETLKEMSTFVKNEDGRASAISGAHDDLVMASAIARFVAIDYDHGFIRDYNGSAPLPKELSLPLQNNSFLEW